MKVRATLSVLLLGAAAWLAPSAATATAAACAGASDFDGDGVDDVAVGDPFAEGQRGAVHVLSGGKVVPVTVPDLAEGDGFGWSVRLAKVDADACADLVVGAPYTDVDGRKDAGAAYVIYGGGAAAPQRIVAPDAQRGARLGWSLAARGDLVAIGAPYEDDGDVADAGAIYVRKGTGGLRRISQQSTDVRGNSEVGDQFGWSLAMGPGNGLVVGVPYENDDGVGQQVDAGKVDAGSVVVIEDVLAGELATVKLDSPTAASDDKYGYAVAWVDGVGLAVGVPGPGYVQIYDDELEPARRVRQSGTEAFGFSLAASADGRLAIGAPYGGSVRIVTARDGKDVRRFAPAVGLFGYALAFSGNKLVMGQPDALPYGKVSVAARNSDELAVAAAAEGGRLRRVTGRLTRRGRAAHGPVDEPQPTRSRAGWRAEQVRAAVGPLALPPAVDPLVEELRPVGLLLHRPGLGHAGAAHELPHRQAELVEAVVGAARVVGQRVAAGLALGQRRPVQLQDGRLDRLGARRQHGDEGALGGEGVRLGPYLVAGREGEAAPLEHLAHRAGGRGGPVPGAVGEDVHGASGVDGERHARQRHVPVSRRGQLAGPGEVELGQRVAHGGGGDQPVRGAAVDGQLDGTGVAHLDARRRRRSAPARRAVRDRGRRPARPGRRAAH